MSKPVELQTFPQAQASAGEDLPYIGRRNAQFLTDRLGVEFQPFAHHEHPTNLPRQRIQASLKHFEKLGLLQHLGGRIPDLWRVWN